MYEPYMVFAILLAMLSLFVIDYWRYDVVAMIALLALVILKILPYNSAFMGFSSPAVITVACVMIMTDTITQSGAADYVVNKLTPVSDHAVLHLTVLTVVTGFLSAFMNNVGALALMMPIAIQTSVNANRSPSLVLMPIAFASVLGGLTTAIGTPPNLLIAAYREQTLGHSFSMFDFTPVGLMVASVAILFIAILGWRLLPERRKAGPGSEEMYQIQDYISEVTIPESSPYVEKYLNDIETEIEGDYSIIGFIRGKRKRFSIPRDEQFRAGDILIVEASHDVLEEFLKKGKFELVGTDMAAQEILSTSDIGLMEAVVSPGARIESRSWSQLRIRSRYRINLIAIARSGRRFRERLNQVSLRAGDVVLVQGDNETLQESILALGLLPLINRGVTVGFKNRMFLPVAVFFSAISLAACGVVPVQISFALAVVALVVFNVIPSRRIYKAVDWSIIILLGALIPIGDALQRSGGTDLIANSLLSLAGSAPPSVILILLLMITMTLSDIMNNVATAVVMAPIAVSMATSMKLNVDPFLMAVAVGASCSFLTPISHQNNTLVFGPGGYSFTDYMRLGLPVELIVLLTGIPMILYYWPLK